jgi:hypothetical protein
VFWWTARTGSSSGPDEQPRRGLTGDHHPVLGASWRRMHRVDRAAARHLRDESRASLHSGTKVPVPQGVPDGRWSRSQTLGAPEGRRAIRLGAPAPVCRSRALCGAPFRVSKYSREKFNAAAPLLPQRIRWRSAIRFGGPPTERQVLFRAVGASIGPRILCAWRIGRAKLLRGITQVTYCLSHLARSAPMDARWLHRPPRRLRHGCCVGDVCLDEICAPPLP